jgi:hypothetical protein
MIAAKPRVGDVQMNQQSQTNADSQKPVLDEALLSMLLSLELNAKLLDCGFFTKYSR